MRDVGADDFDDDALIKNFFKMFGKFFHGRHHSYVIDVIEVVNFVDFNFGDDESVTGGFGFNIEKSVGAVVFVNFVRR